MISYGDAVYWAVLTVMDIVPVMRAGERSALYTYYATEIESV